MEPVVGQLGNGYKQSKVEKMLAKRGNSIPHSEPLYKSSVPDKDIQRLMEQWRKEDHTQLTPLERELLLRWGSAGW